MSKTILIVEDNDASRELLIEMYRAEGYHAVGASDGVDGIAMALESDPDLVLMDIRLPNISGLVLADFIRGHEDLKTIPIVAITAFAVADEELDLTSRCDALLPKPFSFDELLATTERLLKPAHDAAGGR